MRMVMVLMAWSWIGAGLSAQAPRSLIEQALDEPAKVALNNVTLAEAMQQLTEQTGVRIHMPDFVRALVPGGDQTLVRQLDLTNAPLRDGLRQMFSPLGMGIEVRDGFVEVVPHPALSCLGRAPTWPELGVLGELEKMRPGTDEAALSRLRPLVQFAVAARDGWPMLADAIRSVGAGSADRLLTLACDRLGLAWCLSGDHLVIRSKVDQVRERLLGTISLRVNYRPLVEVLHEISKRIGIPVKTEPGALASVPIQVQRSFSINVADATIEHVLDRVAAFTGLAYAVEPEGVLFYRVIQASGSGSDIEAAGAGSTSQPPPMVGFDPYVGKIVVPLPDGTSIEWHIRMSELPSDLRHRRAGDLERAFRALRLKTDDSSGN